MPSPRKKSAEDPCQHRCIYCHEIIRKSEPRDTLSGNQFDGSAQKYYHIEVNDCLVAQTRKHRAMQKAGQLI